jgi:hypothetical protein
MEKNCERSMVFVQPSRRAHYGKRNPSLDGDEFSPGRE